MERRGLRNFVTFLLVLALTIGAVGWLSSVVPAQAEGAFSAAELQAHNETEPAPVVTELSAVLPQREETFSWVNLSGFLLLLSIPAAGMLGFYRARRRGKDYRSQGRRRYSPRADMSLSHTRFVRSRV